MYVSDLSSCTVMSSLAQIRVNELVSMSTRGVDSNLVCTVTGSTLIDFYGRVHSVADCCVNQLFSSRGTSQFELLAGFMERCL